MSRSGIDNQVAFYNDCFINIGKAHKDKQFQGLTVYPAALGIAYDNLVSTAVSFTPDQVKLLVAESINFPENVRAQFGAISKKRKLEKEKKVPKVVPPSPPVPPTPPTPSPNANANPKAATNSVNCVNHAASLMASQWPSGSAPPTGCQPSNGKPCTRNHTMVITAGQPIAKGLVTDLLGGIGGFKKNPTFIKAFTDTIKAWK
jgi:hypothetical protein